MTVRLLLLFGLLTGSTVVSSCSLVSETRGQTRPEQSLRRTTTTVEQDSVDHRPFDRLLDRFVDEEGNVDYAGLKANAASVLAPYLNELAQADLSGLDRDARLAFWINAYNALTLKLIVEHYPVENIWAVTPGPAAPKDKNSPFAIKVGRVADTMRTLDEIEHEIIRPHFDEPRIHFALVCAAVSCPTLRREAYRGSRLDVQLDDQTRAFFHDEAKNRIPAGDETIALTRILKWYGRDVGPTSDALQRFIASYFQGRVQKRLAAAAYEVTFLPYDWSLNDQANSSKGEAGP